MNRIITTLFKERGFLIEKQFTLARNLKHMTSIKNTELTSHDYRSMLSLQQEIMEKEKTISENIKNLGIHNKK